MMRSADMGDAVADVGKGIGTAASTLATIGAVGTAIGGTAAGAAAGTAVGGVLAGLGVSAAAVSAIPVAGWIAGAALAVAAAVTALVAGLDHDWSPDEAAAGLDMMTGYPALFGLLIPPAAWTNESRREDIWASLMTSWQSIAKRKVDPKFTDRKFIAGAIRQGEAMAALPGPVGARFLLATLPPADPATDVPGYDAWRAYLATVAKMSDSEFARSDHAKMAAAMDALIAGAIGKARGAASCVSVADVTLLAEKRGALWALAHPPNGAPAPPAVKAADDFRAYVSSWHGPYEGRDYGDAPFQYGCPANLRANAQKALGILRAQPEALGWLDLAWVSTLGYSRAYNFGSLADFCAQAEQVKDMLDGFAHCIDGDEPLNDDDVIRNYLAAARAKGAPGAKCTGVQARCFRQGVPYLDARNAMTKASSAAPAPASPIPLDARTPDQARAVLAAWRFAPPIPTPENAAIYDRLRLLAGKAAPDLVLGKVFPQALVALPSSTPAARPPPPPRAPGGGWAPNTAGRIGGVDGYVDGSGTWHIGARPAPAPATPAAISAVAATPTDPLLPGLPGPDDPDLSGFSALFWQS